MITEKELLLFSGLVFESSVLSFLCDIHCDVADVVLFLQLWVTNRHSSEGGVPKHNVLQSPACSSQDKVERRVKRTSEGKMNCFLIYAFLFFFFGFQKCQTDSHPCKYPPSQWCSSLEIAVECGVSCKLLNISQCVYIRFLPHIQYYF